MKRGLLSLVAILCVASIVMTGCAQKSSNTPKKTAPQVLKVTYAGSPEPAEKEYVVNTFAKGFEKKYNAKLEIDFVPQADGIKKISSEQESKNIVSDIIFADTANMAPYVNGGWMEDITDTVKNSGSTITNMFDGSTMKDGKRYFVPVTFDVYITIANKKALKYR